MFQSVKEEGPGGEGSGHHLDTPPRKVTVKRSESKPKERKPKQHKKPSGSQVDEGEGPQGFDDFALY